MPSLIFTNAYHSIVIHWKDLTQDAKNIIVKSQPQNNNIVFA